VQRESREWHIAARPSDLAKLPDGRRKKVIQNREHRKASVRAKVERWRSGDPRSNSPKPTKNCRIQDAT